MVLKSHCLLIAGLSAACVFAASDDVPFFAPPVERWGVQEITLQSRKTHDKPFTDPGNRIGNSKIIKHFNKMVRDQNEGKERMDEAAFRAPPRGFARHCSDFG